MKISLTRTSGSWWNERRYKIFIQDKQVATLKPGASQVIEIDASPVTIEAKFDWYGSGRVSLLVDDGDIIELFDNARFSKQAPFVGVPIPILVMFYRGVNILWIKWAFAAMLATILFWMFYILVIARQRWIIVNQIKR